MFGMEMLEIGIGLTLIYLLLASVCSAIRERIEAIFKTRATDLEIAISTLLNDDKRELTEKVYQHPLIDGLFKGIYDKDNIISRGKKSDKENGFGIKKISEKIGGLFGHVKKENNGMTNDNAKDSQGRDTNTVKPSKNSENLPSYIPSKNFALAFLDVVASGVGGAIEDGPSSLAALKSAVEASELNANVKATIRCAIDSAGGDLAQVHANLESWFNSAMDRASGWYRRRTQSINLITATVLAILLNVNTLTIIERLSIDGSLREALVKQASSPPSDASTWGGDQNIKALDKLNDLTMPIGWSQGWPGPKANPLKDTAPNWPVSSAEENYFKQAAQWIWFYVFHPIIGWFITAIAVSMGAPFWFDTLNRLTSLRSTLKPREIESEKSTTDTSSQTVVTLQTGNPASTSEPGGLSAFEANSLTEVDIQAVQRALGILPDKVSGILDQSTRLAIQQWQAARGDKPTGILDESSVIELLYS